MIDLTEHVKSVVKDELAKACSARGIDKRQAGFAIGGFGDIGLVPTGQGSFQPMTHWCVTVSLPPVLLGQEQRPADSLCVSGLMPSDDQFRAAVRRLVAAVDNIRNGLPPEAPQQQQNNGQAPPAPPGLFLGTE